MTDNKINSSVNNKRIAKNTMYLYSRMFVTILVSLYTVRIVLAALGEVDYGIYNIIGGIVVLFSFLNHAMNTSVQRFLSYEIGRNDQVQLKRVFSMSVNSHMLMALFILIVSETLGVWFLNSQMNIPDERMYAANWVFQFCILTFILHILRVPYNGCIISFERMSIYANLSIAEVLMSLGIVYLLTIGNSVDRLILYAGLKCFVSLICWIASYIYCKCSFCCCDYAPFWDKGLFKRLFSFSGWSMLGAGSVIVTQSGSNILLNIFSGVVVNAAYGISSQVSNAIYGFVSNFQIAFQPQIIKLYAAGKREEQIQLVNRASIISYYLLLLISVPFILDADIVFELWLKDVPDYSISFCQWMLAYSMIDAIQAPLWMLITASGNIKLYSIWSSSLVILNLPMAWFLLYCGYSPLWIFITRFVINLITAIIRIFYVKAYFSFPILVYTKMVFTRAIPVTIIAFVGGHFINELLDKNILSFILSTTLMVVFIILVIFSIGLRKNERKFVVNIVKEKINKLKL